MSAQKTTSKQIQLGTEEQQILTHSRTVVFNPASCSILNFWKYMSITWSQIASKFNEMNVRTRRVLLG